MENPGLSSSAQEPAEEARITAARKEFHAALLKGGALSVSMGGQASVADGNSKTSKFIARGMIDRLLGEVGSSRLAGQTGGKALEDAVRDFLNELMPAMAGLQPGEYRAQRNRLISDFSQYHHLKVLEELAAQRQDVKIALGGDYMIKPDVVVFRNPLADDDINRTVRLVDAENGVRATLRAAGRPALHASISCKLTIRSDRSQNSRLEALNLIRNRRGRVPHIVVVTAEPLPTRIASIALGTGDFDCIYHIALPELHQAAIDAVADERTRRRRPDREPDVEKKRRLQKEQLELMIEAGRLKDIADLPLDLLL